MVKNGNYTGIRVVNLKNLDGGVTEFRSVFSRRIRGFLVL